MPPQYLELPVVVPLQYFQQMLGLTIWVPPQYLTPSYGSAALLALTLMRLLNWIALKLIAEYFQQVVMDPFATSSSSGKSECPYCLKIVATSLLERHMAIHITGRAGYSCGVCYKIFERKDSLKKHEKVHTGEKPHACKYCDYRSSQSSNLNTHIRTKHPDILANLNKAVRTKQLDDNGS